MPLHAFDDSTPRAGSTWGERGEGGGGRGEGGGDGGEGGGRGGKGHGSTLAAAQAPAAKRHRMNRLPEPTKERVQLRSSPSRDEHQRGGSRSRRLVRPMAHAHGGGGSGGSGDGIDGNGGGGDGLTGGRGAGGNALLLSPSANSGGPRLWP